jgi:hypothetical protein
VGGVCIYTASDTQEKCNLNSTEGYTWDWDSRLCHKDEFSGGEAACTALGASHEFFTCAGADQASCAEFCEATHLTDQSSCEASSNYHHWMWSEQKCRVHNHWANQAVGTACSSINTTDDCYKENNCYWDSEANVCKGEASGCNLMSARVPGGSYTWRGDTGLASTVKAKLLRCEFNEWEPCSTKQTCEAAGECSDWWAEGGVCVVPHQANEWGHREDCGQRPGNNAGFSYEWADKVGCIVTKKQGDSVVRVGENECLPSSYSGARWLMRAKNSSQCLGHGEVCHSQYNDWDLYGGMNKTTCDKCDNVYSPTSRCESTSRWRKRAGKPRVLVRFTARSARAVCE